MRSPESLRRPTYEALVVLLVMTLLAMNPSESSAQELNLENSNLETVWSYYDQLVVTYGEDLLWDQITICDDEEEDTVPSQPSEESTADIACNFEHFGITVSVSEELAGTHIYEILAAQNYLAGTEADSNIVAQQINFRPQNNFEHVSNMCGSLSAQILYDAGIITDDMFENGFQSADFWLSDPERLKQLFPEEYFSIHDFTNLGVNAGEFNFQDFPLLPGDFVYLLGGNYDHIIAVSKVEVSPDGDSRAYTVTNVYTDSGWQIQERMLFDTTQPDLGLFDSYQRPNSWEGWTGARGIVVVRRNKINNMTRPNKLDKKVKQLLIFSITEISRPSKKMLFLFHE